MDLEFFKKEIDKLKQAQLDVEEKLKKKSMKRIMNKLAQSYLI